MRSRTQGSGRGARGAYAEADGIFEAQLGPLAYRVMLERKASRPSRFARSRADSARRLGDALRQVG